MDVEQVYLQRYSVFPITYVAPSIGHHLQEKKIIYQILQQFMSNHCTNLTMNFFASSSTSIQSILIQLNGLKSRHTGKGARRKSRILQRQEIEKQQGKVYLYHQHQNVVVTNCLVLMILVVKGYRHYLQQSEFKFSSRIYLTLRNSLPCMPPPPPLYFLSAMGTGSSFLYKLIISAGWGICYQLIKWYVVIQWCPLLFIKIEGNSWNAQGVSLENKTREIRFHLLVQLAWMWSAQSRTCARAGTPRT